MARSPKKNAQTGVNIGSAEARESLPICTTEPHWVTITPGTALGYFKGARDRCWYVRQRVGGRYVKQRIGTADDGVKADGEIVLSHGQAVKRAVTLQLEERKPLPRHYADGLTLNQVFDAYLEQRQTTPGGRSNRTMPATTAKMSEGMWNRHARTGIGAKLVTALDAKALRQWHTSIASTAPTVRGKAQPFDPADAEQARSRKASANRILTMAKAALSWARVHNPEMPADMADWWRNVKPFGLGDDPVPRMMDMGEIVRLLNAAPADLRTLLQGALMTGARLGELRSLRVRDFDADHATVTIRQTKSYKTLMQPLTTEGVALFESLTAGRDKAAHVFTRADGTPWNTKDVIRPMRAAAIAAKLDDVSFKTTRATYGKLLLVATKDLELVAKALGHSDSRITRKHYAAVLPSEVKEGIAKLPSLGIMPDTKVSPIGRKKRRAA